jgi:hypothetical protein
MNQHGVEGQRPGQHLGLAAGLLLLHQVSRTELTSAAGAPAPARRLEQRLQLEAQLPAAEREHLEQEEVRPPRREGRDQRPGAARPETLVDRLARGVQERGEIAGATLQGLELHKSPPARSSAGPAARRWRA